MVFCLGGWGVLLADLLSDSVVISVCWKVLVVQQYLLSDNVYWPEQITFANIMLVIQSYFLSLLIYLLHHLKFIVLCFDPGWGTKGTTPTCWVCIAGLFLLRKVTTYATDVLTVLCSHNHIVWFGTVQKLEVRRWMSFSIICSARSCKNHVILRACLLNIWSLKIYDFQTFLNFACLLFLF